MTPQKLVPFGPGGDLLESWLLGKSHVVDGDEVSNVHSGEQVEGQLCEG